jgi:hypothetical protein
MDEAGAPSADMSIAQAAAALAGVKRPADDEAPHEAPPPARHRKLYAFSQCSVCGGRTPTAEQLAAHICTPIRDMKRYICTHVGCGAAYSNVSAWCAMAVMPRMGGSPVRSARPHRARCSSRRCHNSRSTFAATPASGACTVRRHWAISVRRNLPLSHSLQTVRLRAPWLRQDVQI